MIPKTEAFRAAMSAIREQIAVAKRRGTRNDFIDILEDATKATGR